MTLLITLFQLLSLSASAADTSNPVVKLDSITITGTKSEKPYTETTQSVTVLQESDLTPIGSENSIQILNAVPNVQVNKNGESFSIRGISNTGVTGYQKDNLASILIDDFFQTDLAIQAGSFDLWDFERIEILKGAQSTTQGVNSLAGTILLNHRAPQYGSEGMAKIGVGNFWNREAGVVTNPVLLDKRFALRISYNKEMNNSYIKNLITNNDQWGAWNRDRVRVAGAFKINDRDEVELTTKYNRNRQGGTYVQGVDPFQYEVTEDQDSNNVTENYQAISKYKHRFDSQFDNQLIAGISKSNQNSSSDADGTQLNTAGTRLEKHNDQFISVENRLQYTGEKIKNLLGFHAHHFKLDDDYDFNLLYPVGGGSTPVKLLQQVNRSRETYSLFDSFDYRFDSNHSFNLGLRTEYVRSSYGTDVNARRLQDLGAGTNAAIDNYLNQRSGNYSGNNSNLIVLPKAAYLFEFDDQHFGLSYTRGYRTGGLSINRARATPVEYNPEYTNNYEFSYRYANGPIQVSSNVFYTDWRSQQVQISLSNDFFDTQVVNAARSEVKGGEIELRANVNSNHTLAYGVGYTDTRFVDFVNGSNNYAGLNFPFASKWTSRLSHEASITDQIKFLTVARYVSSGYSNALNTRQSDAQFYLDWNGKYVVGNWVAELYLKNILDGQYLIFDGSTNNQQGYQARYHQVSTPREYGLRLTYLW